MPQDAKNALKILGLVLRPIEREEAVYWLGRMLAHFPRRDTDQDAIVLSDLSSDLVDEKIGIGAVVEGCKEIRQSGTDRRPFLPPSGEIMKRCRQRQAAFVRLKGILSSDTKALPSPKEREASKLEPPEWDGRKWEDLNREVRQKLWIFLGGLPPSTKQTYCQHSGYSFEEIENWASVYLREE